MNALLALNQSPDADLYADGAPMPDHKAETSESFIQRGRALNANMRRYIDMRTEQVHAVEALCSQTGFDARRIVKQDDLKSEFRDIAREAISTLVSVAAEKFAPNGSARLKIDDSKWLYKYQGDVANGEVDFEKLCRELNDQYGGENGANMGYRAAAKHLVSGFWLKRNREVKRVGGSILLEQSISVDKTFARDGGYELSYHYQESVNEVLSGLAAACGWGGLSLERAALEAFRFRVRDRFRSVKSRERLTVSPSITITTFYNKFEYRFSEQVGQVLQMFIANFGVLDND